jgi:hypothetical protein
MKIAPRMNFSYNYPRVSLDTPQQHYNSYYQESLKGAQPPQGVRNGKISLYSPKGKINSNEPKQRPLIKLRSPIKKE